MTRIDPIEPSDAKDDDINELLDDVEEVYNDSAFYGAIAHQPEILKQLLALFDYFPQSNRITPEMLELMRLKVAEDNQCTYCVTVRTQDVKDSVKAKEGSIFGDIEENMLTKREVLAVTLAEQLSNDPHGLSDAFFDELRSEFSEQEIVELILFGCIEIGLDRFPPALKLDTDERSPYPTELEYPADQEYINRVTNL
jgi:alkylhydroperoxidase family enzyme